MLSENEIFYVKNLLKQNMVNWENKDILIDLYRHAKFTIRQLTKQMANIDNHNIFKKFYKPDRTGTLLMMYKAERLYCALGDAKKIFKLIAMLIFDEKKLDEIQNSLKGLVVSDADEKFVKKRF